MKLAIAIIIISISGFMLSAYAQDTERTPTRIEKLLTCEYSFDPDKGSYDSLRCSNPEMDLCLLRTDLTDVGGGMTWNIMNPILCEGGQNPLTTK